MFQCRLVNVARLFISSVRKFLIFNTAIVLSYIALPSTITICTINYNSIFVVVDIVLHCLTCCVFIAECKIIKFVLFGSLRVLPVATR